MPQTITVLGAGIVGVCCALELQKRGYQVTLVDRRGPGEETSSGNAGLLSYSNVTPIAAPELLPRVHRLLLNLDADFLLHYPHFGSLLPWLVKFVLRCRRSTYLHDGNLMSSITLPSIDLHKQLIAEAGVEHLRNNNGGLKLYRDHQTFLRDRLERELLSICGIRHTIFEDDEMYELEPDLHRVFDAAVLINDTISIRNPEKLCKAYAKLFFDAGGEFRQSECKTIEPDGGGWIVGDGQQQQQSDRLVVCMGAWTPVLIGQLGYANPLAIERGYHTVFAAAEGRQLSRPIFDVDSSYVMAPMEMGLRVSTGSNLVYRETGSTPKQLELILPRVREAFPVAENLMQEPWMGRRPTLPDTLPILGPAPRHRNLWLAFGHSHMGLTQGPISGQIIADFVSGCEQSVPATICDPARYL